ncbi:glycosyltransferase family 2 protein [Actinopolyspora sp. H202]|uniref:glycosyltransferase family 2 protein n=1 Tax=Actinopolyspora sp. H202 TaxID=1500456 RepID=UPI003EE443BB
MTVEQARSTIVVVTWRGAEHIGACLDALARQRNHRLLVVDNASDDGTDELLARHPSAPEVLRLPHNLGYAGGLAAAFRLVRTPYFGWLNDDAAPAPGWLATLEEALDRDPGTGAAASRMWNERGPLSSGIRLTGTGHGTDTVAGDGTEAADIAGTGDEVFGFCGGAALLRSSALSAVGGIPADYFCYYEDTDTSWRLRLAGYGIARTTASCEHSHGCSSDLGSARFHRWNERNRLLTLLRCAPVEIALRELLRFGAITLALPWRRLRQRRVPDAANFRVPLRLGVLAEVAAGAPTTLRQRRGITEVCVVARRRLWRSWAGK